MHNGQVQHDNGLANKAAVKVVYHLNLTLTLASTGDLDLRPDRVAQGGDEGCQNTYLWAVIIPAILLQVCT